MLICIVSRVHRRFASHKCRKRTGVRIIILSSAAWLSERTRKVSLLTSATNGRRVRARARFSQAHAKTFEIAANILISDESAIV